MSLDLYQRDVAESIGNLTPIREPEAGAFDGFLRGTGMGAMRTFAQAGRAASMAAIGVISAPDRVTGGVELGDRMFKWHDEVLGNAVDRWTPKPNEVGVAGQIAGQLVGMLPLIIASPAGAIAATGLGTAEDLVRKDVDPTKATAVGAVQAAGLGVGIWLPILGTTGFQRVVVGGAGANVAQGVAIRGASGAILHGTTAEHDFKAFDGEALTLDALLGLAFGSIAHVSPAARAQGAEAWKRVESWAKNLEPSQVDALAALRQAQHLNVDSAPGKLETPQDVDAHVNRARTAVDQLARDEAVHVEDQPAPRVVTDPERVAANEARAAALAQDAERVLAEEGIPKITETEGPAPTIRAEPPPPRGEGGEAPAPRPEGEQVDPVVVQAERFANEQPDLAMRVGQDADGKPIVKTAKQFLADAKKEAAKARKDTALFEIAAACALGVA